ncbi:MAG: phosphatidylserine decarboxylase [Gammaproteobacteria bacterium]|nr:phosphatidylserine decarboxylase [Gammaproteobacteria bacterium]
MLPIAKELQSVFIFGTLIVIGVQFIAGPYAILLWVPWLIFFFFIRDFHRDIPPIPLAIISPVDGVVTAIKEVQNPFIDQSSFCYTIEQSHWGEFNMHSPIEGKVEQLWVREPSHNKKALVFWVRTDELDDVVTHVLLESTLQHASTALHPGERVGQGRRCGFVAVGCKVNIYLPKNVKQIAAPGDRVTAGKNILSQFIH